MSAKSVRTVFHMVFVTVMLASSSIALGGRSCANPVRSDAPLDAKQFEALWIELEKGEADATRALLKLSVRPKETVTFLKTKMQPLKINAERARILLGKLANSDEKIWKPAFEELEYFDPRLAIDLATLMNEVLAAPARQRMVEVMSGRPAESLTGRDIELRAVGQNGFNFFAQMYGSWWAEHLVARINSTGYRFTHKKWTRAERALVLLEHIGTPEAQALLTEMATGHPDAQPTKIAKEALKRIAGK